MANGFSAHFGLNELFPENYEGWDGRLASCEADALAMAAIARQQGFKHTEIYLSAQATIDTFTRCMEQLSRQAWPGDLVFLSFSGHGGQVLDLDKDEDDGNDETWCFFDGPVVDDRIFELLCQFRAGVRILAISDSCHSGTITRLIPEAWDNRMQPFAPAPSWRKKEDELQASVILLASCQDHETATAGPEYSRFTSILLEVWAEARFEGNYRKFLDAIGNKHPFEQNPNYYVIGPRDEGFEEGRVFGV